MQTFLSLVDRGITAVPKPELITEIGLFAFAGCTSLTTDTFPNCTKIHQGAFIGCTDLAELSLPSCATIDTTALSPVTPWNNAGIADYSGIVSLNMPALSECEYNCFKDMKQLKIVHLESCTTLNDIFLSNSPSIEQVYCPQVTTLKGRVFGYLGEITKDVYFYMTQRTTAQIISMSLGSHFGNTPTAKWTLFHFIGSDGSVEYDTSTSSWVATPNA